MDESGFMSEDSGRGWAIWLRRSRFQDTLSRIDAIWGGLVTGAVMAAYDDIFLGWPEGGLGIVCV
jgi:hypothetical protein